MFTVKDLVEKIGDDPICYLTGRKIDLNHSKAYHLDHVVPKSRGGDDTLDNCQIACREANFAKGDLSYDEFIQLCKEVLEHHENKLSKNKID
jgi:5-methylcytosine-specific restriction endonuclease McrA